MQTEKDFIQKGWLSLLEEDNNLYTTYLKILNEFRIDPPGFWSLDNNTTKDQLRGVWLYDMDFDSSASCVNYLNYYTRFLLKPPVAQKNSGGVK